jgi:hypothetical protein
MITARLFCGLALCPRRSAGPAGPRGVIRGQCRQASSELHIQRTDADAGQIRGDLVSAAGLPVWAPKPAQSI